MRKWVACAAFGAIVAVLAGCVVGAPPIGMAPSYQVEEMANLPSPVSGDYLSGVSEDTLRPRDELKIEVFNVPQLTREVRVGAVGTFEYPLVGTVIANGRTASEVAVDIAGRLRGRYVLRPEVTVELEAREGQLITVGGEVKKPGQYPISQPTTLMQVVAIGGGTAEFASLDDVLIFRNVEGQRYIGVYSLSAIQRGNYEDPRVFPNDIVMVGDSPDRRLLTQIIGLAPLVTTPVILLDRLAR